MPSRINLTGTLDTNIEVIGYAGNKRWHCKCHCGRLFTTLGYGLRTGQTKSCGCLPPAFFCGQLATQPTRGSYGYMKPKLMEASKVKQLAKRSPRLRQGLNPNKACAICGALFYASPAQVRNGGGSYCGFTCRSVGVGGDKHPNWKAGEGRCQCARCGKEYHQKPSKIRSGRHKKYCSRACRMAGLVRVNTCVSCGVEFTITHRRSHARKWCSKDCMISSRIKIPNRQCVTCGKQFYNKEAGRTKPKQGAGSFCSTTCKYKFMSGSPRTIGGAFRGVKGIRGGRRPDLGNIYFRSRWEANYARYLNWLISIGEIAAWEFEPDTFEFPVKRGNRFYTPDFKVWRKGGGFEYHEVKGWMDRGSATKLKRMSIHHKNVKVVVIDSAYYRALAKQIASSIPGWERDGRGSLVE